MQEGISQKIEEYRCQQAGVLRNTRNDTDLIMCGQGLEFFYFDIKEKAPKKRWGFGNIQLMTNLIFASCHTYVNHTGLPQWNVGTCIHLYISPILRVLYCRTGAH